MVMQFPVVVFQVKLAASKRTGLHVRHPRWLLEHPVKALRDSRTNLVSSALRHAQTCSNKSN